MNSDHRRTSEGIPSGRGSFLLMHSAMSIAVCIERGQSKGHHMSGEEKTQKLTCGSMKRGTPKSTAFRRIT